MVRTMLATVVAVAATAVASIHGAVVPHDSIPVWAEPAPADNTQNLAVRFKPQLNVVNGCQPYPAVDASGNTSGGLATSGSPSSGCADKSKAQVYSRSGTYNGKYAIMYSWYMAKDSPSAGLGHRHDWENMVVWLDSNNVASAKVVAAAASAHGNYKKSYPINTSFLANSGLSTKIDYKSTWPVNHELGFTTAAGASQPLIQWEQLTAAAQNALETTNFDSATVPFKSNFQTNLAKAYYL